MPLPSLEERKKLLGKWLNDEDTLNSLAEQTEGFTRGDVVKVAKCVNNGEDVEQVVKKCKRCIDQEIMEINKWKEDFG